MKTPSKVVIVGLPGAGKTTLARRIHEKTGFQLFHADELYCYPDGSKYDMKAAYSFLKDATHRQSWILDGWFDPTFTLPLNRADVVIHLDYNPVESLKQAYRRGRNNEVRGEYGASRKHSLNLPFILRYMLGLHALGIATMLALAKPKCIVTLRSREETEKWLEEGMPLPQRRGQYLEKPRLSRAPH
ncbi:MAG: hypothetical protein AB7G06_04175 [Bdellovibrionales bacterium]